MLPSPLGEGPGERSSRSTIHPMAQPRVLARGLLLVFLLVTLLAAPVVFAVTLADAATPQQSDTSASPASAAAITGSTPEYAGSAKLARPQAAPAQADANHIVISEFRWRGPAGPADEFIELYNPTNSAITIENWTLWKTGGCVGSPGLMLTFGTGSSVPAGGHYLVGGLLFSGSADILLYDIGIPDKGGLALVDGSSINPDNSNIIDQVGTESQADCPGSTTFYEGTSLAQLTPDSNSSYERKYGGAFGSCVDTDNNAADFSLKSPSDPQTSTDPTTPCSTPTATPTNTPTDTPTPTNTPVCTGVVPSPLLVLINEVAWYGTLDNSQDYWIELYNTHPICAVDLENWRLVGIRSGGQTFEIDFNSDDDIAPQGFMVITSNDITFKPELPVNVEKKVASSLALGSLGQSLQLLAPDDVLVDTANYSPTGTLGWPAGTTSNRRSMERYRPTVDTRTNWVTFYRPLPFPTDWPRARNGNNFIYGTPGMPNWAIDVTLTPSPVPTKARVPTARPPTPFAHMVINEFLPRAGTDWNQDGSVDVYDEFIELKNLGPIDVDLANWKLDDVAGAGSPMFTLPSRKLKPGERAVFYGLTTRILLEDTGDTVRLINSRGIVIDARSYGVVEHPDESHCRIPDGYYWRLVCFPTPGNENALTGLPPAPVPIVLGAPPPCLLADTVPEPFRQAECYAFGEDMWDRTYWDGAAGFGVFTIQSGHTKWKTSVE